MKLYFKVVGYFVVVFYVICVILPYLFSLPKDIPMLFGVLITILLFPFTWFYCKWMFKA